MYVCHVCVYTYACIYACMCVCIKVEGLGFRIKVEGLGFRV